MTQPEFTAQLNEWGRNKVPFLFVADFEMKKPFALKLDEINPAELLFDINGVSNTALQHRKGHQNLRGIIRKHPITPLEYRDKFDRVQHYLGYGDTFLTNLTIDTEVQLTHSLYDLFFLSQAKYKLWYKDQFLVFSPEIFIKINNGRIYSFPMKGTIDGTVPNAQEAILNDKKELAEHVTIVDLIRNDLSQVAADVKVTRFRYVDELKTDHKTLLQVSSEISGELSGDYASHLGDILVNLLPAGSVSGAPKPKTLTIIKEVEKKDRGYYTGVFGYFDGTKLDSGVMIRFIERREDQYFYRSGGGITTQSLAESEYQEAIDKVYVPVS